jgi:hypothetical protein
VAQVRSGISRWDQQGPFVPDYARIGIQGTSEERTKMTSARTPAGTLVSAFGRPDAMSVLYSPDIQWSLSASLTQFPRPIDGKDAVVAFNLLGPSRQQTINAVEVTSNIGDPLIHAEPQSARAFSANDLDFELMLLVKESPIHLGELDGISGSQRSSRKHKDGPIGSGRYQGTHYEHAEEHSDGGGKANEPTSSLRCVFDGVHLCGSLKTSLAKEPTEFAGFSLNVRDWLLEVYQAT